MAADCPGQALIEHGWVVEDHFALSWWDALIVAAAQAARCRFLLSENMQAGQVFEHVEVVNPFARESGALA